MQSFSTSPNTDQAFIDFFFSLFVHTCGSIVLNSQKEPLWHRDSAPTEPPPSITSSPATPHPPLSAAATSRAGGQAVHEGWLEGGPCFLGTRSRYVALRAAEQLQSFTFGHRHPHLWKTKRNFNVGTWGGGGGEWTLVQSLGWEDHLEEGMATYSSMLVWRIPWTEEPDVLRSVDCKESDMSEWLRTPARTGEDEMSNRVETRVS